jgi:hypothetical protein
METPLITYNLTDRERSYTGNERNFNLKQIAKVINSPETQERVRLRDMLGYYGHWARTRFGMYPNEGDAVQQIEPAIVTTFLEADDDGTIRHKAEFLGTKAGRIAEQLFKSRTGGFSSAIDENKPAFFGFDYVLSPNFSGNRGYELALDSTGKTDIKSVTLDDMIIAESNEQIDDLLSTITNLNAANTLALDSLNRLAEENEELLSMLTKYELSKSTKPAFDGIGQAAFSTSKHPANRILDDINYFKTAHLPKFAEPKTEINSATSRFFNRLKNGY